MEATRRLRIATALITALLLPSLAAAHPGSGIGVGPDGQVYFVDMVSGIWKVDARGALTHLPGPAFHWMAVDTGGKFARTSLPRGSSGDVVRLEAEPSVILASDFPIAIGGALYYPSHESHQPARLMKMTDAGTASAAEMSKRPRRIRMARHLTSRPRHAGAGYRTPGDGRVLRGAVD